MTDDELRRLDPTMRWAILHPQWAQRYQPKAWVGYGSLNTETGERTRRSSRQLASMGATNENPTLGDSGEE